MALTHRRDILLNPLLKALPWALYALAAASLVWTPPHDAGPVLRRIALVVLAVHGVELLVVYKHVRLYRGPFFVSMPLTLLFGLLHWKPLADARKQVAPG